MKIKIYDALMGSGKTTRIINEINESSLDQKYLFITPLLSECHRIAGTSYDEDDVQKRPIRLETKDDFVLYAYDESNPLSNRYFKHPYFYRGGNKAESLAHLLKNKENIVSTHQLFINLNPDMLKHAKDHILIIDEALTVYEIYPDLQKKEIDAMFRNQWLSLQEDGVTLQFHREHYANVQVEGGDAVTDTRYEDIAALCDLNQLLLIDGKVIVWELAIDTLRAFKEVWIATYLFEGSLMSSYLKAHGVDYELIKFGKSPQEVAELISIYTPKRGEGLNAIGSKKGSLSKSDFHINGKRLKTELNKNLDSWMRNHAKAKKKDRIWTSFKSVSPAIGGRAYSDEWLSFTTKATNKYQDAHNVAYLINLFHNPIVVKANSLKGYSCSHDIYALSEMLQFIWRSAIRKGEPINVYIPSKRMRDLLEKWMAGEIT